MTTETIILSPEDRQSFITAVRMGMGMGLSCEFILRSVQDMTIYFRVNPDFHLEVIHGSKFAARALLSMCNNYLAAEKYDKWMSSQEKLRFYITELVLFEEHCARADVTPEIITKVVHIYKNASDCAAAIGMTKKQFVEYCVSNPDLSLYLTTKHIYSF